MIVTIPCVCPPLADGQPRHESDTVTLRDKLGFRAALTARNAIIVARGEDDGVSVGAILAAMTEAYLLEGIEEWSLRDLRNKPVPIDAATIRAFLDAHIDEALIVGNAADDLYREGVLAPLVRAASMPSPPLPTDEPTSPTTGSRSRNRKPSKPSSITTTPTERITPMWARPAGDSN